MNRPAPATVLITGARRGIGRALAEHYLNQGATVFAAARAIDPSLWPAAPGRLVPVRADITQPEDRAAIRDAVAQSAHPLDLLVNNAGIQNAIDLTAIDAAGFAALAEAELVLNLLAPMLLTQMLLPVLRQPGAAIVNVTSLIARQPKPSAPVYSASKAGLASYTKELHHQLAPLGIAVIEALPPLVETDMTAGRGSGKLSPRDMAEAIAAGIARGARIVAPGKAQALLAINRVVPELAERIMQKA